MSGATIATIRMEMSLTKAALKIPGCVRNLYITEEPMPLSASEASIEAEIQTKGLNAPRLTPAMIDAAIVAEQYWQPFGKKRAKGAINRGLVSEKAAKRHLGDF